MAYETLSGDESRPLLPQHANTNHSMPNSPTKYGNRSKPRPLRTSRSFRYIAEQLKTRDALSPFSSTIEQERVWYDNYTAIDFTRDQVQGARRLERLRSRNGIAGRMAYLSDAVQGWVLCLLIGVLSAVVAYLIMVSEVFLYSAKLGYCRTFLLSSQSNCEEGQFQYWQQNSVPRFFLYSGIALAYALAAGFLTMATLTVFPDGKKLYMAAGSGIPEIKTILGGFVIHGFLGVRTLIVKIAGLTLAVATGMSLGKEGPFVMISCGISNILTRYFPKFAHNETKRREILSSACAAGVAVAFGSPIGGVLFALEEVSYYFPPKVMYRSFFCAAVAAVTLKTLNPHGTGKLVLLETNYEWKEWTTSELPIFLVLGLIGGLYGAFFCTINMFWSRTFRRSKFVASHQILEIAAVCLFTTAVSYWSDLTRMGSTELVDTLLSACTEESPASLCATNPSQVPHIIRSLCIASVIKICLTTITFGLKIPAGIFIPTMCIGSLAGRIIGILLAQLYADNPASWYFKNICPKQTQDCIVPGVYAMIGAAAALAGVTRMTVSLAVIMFELTGSLNYVMPYMIAILTAKWTADALQRRGIYDLIIELNDHPYINAKENHTFGSSKVTDLLPSAAATARICIDVTHEARVCSSALRKLVARTRRDAYQDGGFPIICGESLVGYIASPDITLALDLLPNPDSDVQIIIDPTYIETPSSLPENLYSYSNPKTIDDLLHGVLSSTDFRSIVDVAPVSVQKGAPLELATEMFTKLGLRYLAVVDGNKFLGIIHKKKFVKFLREHR